MDCATLNIIFQVIAAIGSLATFGAFIFLFLRDKDKQAQIDKLAGIATVLEAQNETMKKQNDLIAQEVEILRNTSGLKTYDKDAINSLREIEEKKLKLSVQPNLWLSGTGASGEFGQLDLRISNKGEDAKIVEVNLNSNDIYLPRLSLPFDIDKGQMQKIIGAQKGEKHIKSCEYEIDIIYLDKLKNKYLAKIKGKGIRASILENREIN